ncbi:MAG: hypothetical protein ACODAJ_09380 [Planctomycetota bacterium]
MARKRWVAGATLVAMAAVAVVGPRAAFAGAKEEVPVEDLPKVIVDVLNKLVPGCQILGAEKETEVEDGETQIEYEVELKTKKGKVIEVEIEMTPGGKIKEIEIEDDDD